MAKSQRGQPWNTGDGELGKDAVPKTRVAIRVAFSLEVNSWLESVTGLVESVQVSPIDALRRYFNLNVQLVESNGASCFANVFFEIRPLPFRARLLFDIQSKYIKRIAISL